MNANISRFEKKAVSLATRVDIVGYDGGYTPEQRNIARGVLEQLEEYPPQPEASRLPEYIEVILSQPVHGYWNGGAKSYFKWDLEVIEGGYEKQPRLPWHIKVGSYSANSWFRIPATKNPYASAARRIKKQLRKTDPAAEINIVREEDSRD